MVGHACCAVIRDMGIDVPVAVEIEQVQFDPAQAGIAEFLPAIGKQPRPVVQVDFAGQARLVADDEGIQVAIFVEISQPHAVPKLGELLPGIHKSAASVVQPDLGRVMHRVGQNHVQVAIPIQVTQRGLESLRGGEWLRAVFQV